MKKNIVLLVFVVMFVFSGFGSFAHEEEKGVVVPVLMYHHLSEDVASEAVVSPSKFESDIKTLKAEGFTGIFLSDLHDYLNGHADLPEKPIIITFDDGYTSNYEHAYPIAKEYEMKITISVIGWSLGRDTFMDGIRPITPHFGWEEMREMLSSGYVDIQNHTHDLHSPKGLSYGNGDEAGLGVLSLEKEVFQAYEKRLKKDVLKLNVDIFSETDHMPTFFFYPYGAHDDKSERVLSKLGFVGTLTTIEGVRAYKDLKDLKMIPRLNVPNHLTGQDLIEKIAALKLVEKQ